MAVSLDQFGKAIIAAGLLPADEDFRIHAGSMEMGPVGETGTIRGASGGRKPWVLTLYRGIETPGSAGFCPPVVGSADWMLLEPRLAGGAGRFTAWASRANLV